MGTRSSPWRREPSRGWTAWSTCEYLASLPDPWACPRRSLLRSSRGCTPRSGCVEAAAASALACLLPVPGAAAEPVASCAPGSATAVQTEPVPCPASTPPPRPGPGVRTTPGALVLGSQPSTSQHSDPHRTPLGASLWGRGQASLEAFWGSCLGRVGVAWNLVQPRSYPRACGRCPAEQACTGLCAAPRTGLVPCPCTCCVNTWESHLLWSCHLWVSPGRPLSLPA